MTITVPAITFTTTSIPGATVGQTYSASISATGGTGTITYTLTNGNLPAGLLFNNGQISGVPARGTAGNYTFTVTATSGTASTQQSFTMTVDKGTYDVLVTVSNGLAAGQTRLYVGGIQKGTLRGGESAKLTGLDPDSVVTVSVDNIVTDPGRSDVRYEAASSSATASQDIGQLSFDYFTEYDVELRSDPAGTVTLAGSGWYKDGTPLSVSAPESVSRDADSQYRFAYWLTPSGEKISSETLNAGVKGPGNYIATYELYYKLDVVSQFGAAQGSGWAKAGSATKWSVTPSEVPMDGILGFFGGKYKALVTSGSETVTGPTTVTVDWRPDYTTPAITIPLAILVVAGIVYGIYRLATRPRPQPLPYSTPYQNIPPPPPPMYPLYPMQPPLPPQPPPQAVPPPQTTVVMIGDGLKKPPQGTREQLMEKFGELLQKYEEELAQGRELPSTAELPEVAPISDKKSLPAPETLEAVDSIAERPSATEQCGFGTKKLLRTVVSQWKNTSIKPISVTPGDKKSAALAGGRTVTWSRETYNEWELHICKLPLGHKGMHKGSVEIVYSLLDAINEDRNYGPKQPLKPPAPHYTDGMPEVDIPTSQIVPPDQLPA